MICRYVYYVKLIFIVYNLIGLLWRSWVVHFLVVLKKSAKYQCWIHTTKSNSQKSPRPEVIKLHQVATSPFTSRAMAKRSQQLPMTDPWIKPQNAEVQRFAYDKSRDFLVDLELPLWITHWHGYWPSIAQSLLVVFYATLTTATEQGKQKSGNFIRLEYAEPTAINMRHAPTNPVCWLVPFSWLVLS